MQPLRQANTYRYGILFYAILLVTLIVVGYVVLCRPAAAQSPKNKDRIEKLEEQITQLEARIKALEQKTYREVDSPRETMRVQEAEAIDKETGTVSRVLIGPPAKATLRKPYTPPNPNEGLTPEQIEQKYKRYEFKPAGPADSGYYDLIGGTS